jgi:hypothetical protein
MRQSASGRSLPPGTHRRVFLHCMAPTDQRHRLGGTVGLTLGAGRTVARDDLAGQLGQRPVKVLRRDANAPGKCQQGRRGLRGSQ